MTKAWPERRAQRYFIVEAATGAIAPIANIGDDATHATLADAVRAVDMAAGRIGFGYIGHTRNPDPGERAGYCVYRSGPVDVAPDGDASVRNWEFVAFVEVVPRALADRVWLEPHGEGFLVYSTADRDGLTVCPVSFAEAERIARDFATRSGAHYDPAALRPSR